MVRRALLLLFSPLTALASADATPPRAAEAVAGPYAAQVIETLDGDSFRAEVAIWPGQRVTVIVRIRGVDAPEMHGRCPSERQRALAARDFLAGQLGDTPVMLANIGGGKYYGRVVADVRLGDGGDAANLLLERQLARPYRGGARHGWCATDGG